MGIFSTSFLSVDGRLDAIEKYTYTSFQDATDDEVKAFFYNDPLSTLSLAVTHSISPFEGVNHSVVYRQNNRLDRAKDKLYFRMQDLLLEYDSFCYNRFMQIVDTTRLGIASICSSDDWQNRFNIDALLSASMLSIALKHLPSDIVHQMCMGRPIEFFLSDQMWLLLQCRRKVVSIDRTKPMFDELAAMHAINRYVIDKLGVAPFF